MGNEEAQRGCGTDASTVMEWTKHNSLRLSGHVIMQKSDSVNVLEYQIIIISNIRQGEGRETIIKVD